jgi:DNA-binding CsgD family transcriptional regulator
MIYKIFLLLFFLVACSMASVAQSGHRIDSLEHAFSQNKDIEDKISTLWILSNEFLNSDTSKALGYGMKAYDLANSDGDAKAKIITSLFLAKTFFFLSDLKKAMKYAVKAKILAEDSHLELELAGSLDAIGMIYYDIGNQAKSSENFYASLKIYEKLRDKNGLGATFCRIGTLYLDQKDYDKAVEYYAKSISLAKEINSDEGIASNLNNLAKVYSEKKEYGKALQSYEEALRINLKSGNSYLVGNNYLNIADLYLKRRQYSDALGKVQQAKQIFEKLGNKLRLAKSQVLLSEIFLETGQLSLSESLALSALKIGEANDYKEMIVSASGMLNKLYLSKMDSASAFRYFILEQQYQDSLLLDEKQKTLSKLELQYQFEKNEENARIARQRRNIAIIVISGCLVFCLIIIILILKQLKLKAKKLQLEKANHEQELEFKNKEMVLNVMSLMKKNELLAELSEKLIHIEEESTSEESKDTIKKIAFELQKSQEDEIWKEFSHRFKEVHSEFYSTLLQKYPALTPNELKLCAFLRLNMSSKDIAELTGQRVSSLETARYRLRQKLGIANSDVNLITFLSSI